MRDFFLKNDRWIKIASVLLAIACWFFVMGINDPEIEMTIRRVPVNYIGEGGIAVDYNYQIFSGRVSTINVTVSGARSKLLGLKSSDIIVNVDVSSVDSAGTHVIPCDVKLPMDDISLVRDKKLSVSLFIDALKEVEVPVVAQIQGYPAEGCSLGAAKLSPSTVKIIGPSTEVMNISNALVDIKTGTISESFFGEYSYSLVNHDGSEFVSSYAVKKTGKISATVPVHITKTVPLAISLHELGALSQDNISVNITPREITLAGERAALDSIDSLSLGNVNLTDITDSGYKATLPINIPEGIVNVSEITEADVNIVLKNITSKSFTVTRFRFINQPEDKSATVLEREKQITLRGSESFLASISDSDICLVLDLSGYANSTGKKNVPAEIVVDDTAGGFIPAATYRMPVRIDTK